MAIADWFHAPEVDEVDLSAWTGGVGEALRARARDDMQLEAEALLKTRYVRHVVLFSSLAHAA